MHHPPAAVKRGVDTKEGLTVRYGLAVFVLFAFVLILSGAVWEQGRFSPRDATSERNPCTKGWTAQEMFAYQYWALKANPGRAITQPTLCEACIAAAQDSGLDFAATRERCARACGLDRISFDLSRIGH